MGKGMYFLLLATLAGFALRMAESAAESTYRVGQLTMLRAIHVASQGYRPASAWTIEELQALADSLREDK